MYCISINHKIADAEQRSEYALTEEEKERFFTEIKQNPNIQGMVLLMTCNRNEVYFTGNEESIIDIEKIYARIKETPVAKVRKHFMRYEERSALVHLYNVACGLDSTVLGEVEIIRQIKDAYKYASERKQTDSEINICFQGALSFAKDVAEKSLMTRLPVSVGTLTADAVYERVKNLENPTVLIVGASGNIGSIILKNLVGLSKKIKIIATIRKHNIDLERYADSDKVQFVRYDDRYNYIGQSDVIISATSSPHYTFLVNETETAIHDFEKKHLFIDLAIPRDIDPDIEALRGCQMKNIDFIKALAKENNIKKYSEAGKIKIVINEKVDEQRKNLLFRRYISNNPAMKARMADKNVASLLFQLRDSLDYNTFSKVLETMAEG